MYGISSVLMLLQFFEDEENFEECEKIIKAIEEQEIRLECKLYKRFCEGAVEEFATAHNIDVVKALHHISYYCSLMFDEICDKHTINDEHPSNQIQHN